MTIPNVTGPPLLVGREREQRILRDHLAAALAGRGSLALIGGEAGIGKTALAEVLCDAATNQGARLLVGRCYDLTDTPPYGPWVELFARYQPGDGPSPPAAFAERGIIGSVTSQAALFQQVHNFLATLSMHRPVLLLLDDLHWADPASLDLLRLFARGVASLPIFIIVTYRADELTRGHPLSALLPVLVREVHAERLDLRPLTENNLGELIGTRYRLDPPDMYRLIGYLIERTEGSPFFLDELLRTLEEESALRATDGGWVLGDLARHQVPLLLQRVIDGRVARLGENAHRLLSIAAVIGQEISLDVLATVSDVTEDILYASIDRATEACILEQAQGGTDARFVHALIRETLYDGIPHSRRRTWHRRVGEALAARLSPEPDMIALHFRQARDPRAVKWLIEAGVRAQQSYAWATAAERYEAALAAMDAETADPAERGWLLYYMARMRRYSDPNAALAAFDEAIQCAGAAGDLTLAAYAGFDHGQICCSIGDYGRGVVEMEKESAALDTLSAEDRASLQVRQNNDVSVDTNDRQGTLALWLAYIGCYERARFHGAQAADNLSALSTSEKMTSFSTVDSIADAYHALALVDASMGRCDEAQQHYATARHLYRTYDHFINIGSAAVWEMISLMLPFFADHLVARRRLAIEAEQAYAGTRSILADDVSPRLAALPLLILEGDWNEANELALAAWRVGHHGFMHVITVVLGALMHHRGETDAAWEIIQRILPAGPRTEPAGHPTNPGPTFFLTGLAMQRLAAMLACDASDMPFAREWLEAHDRWLAWSGAVLGQSEGQLGWANYYRAAGEADRAYQHATQALAHATAPRQPLALLAAHRLLGELDTDAARFDDAANHLGSALMLADACAAPYERASTFLALAELRIATGQADDAQVHLDAARAICSPLDAHPALARADALIARLAAMRDPATSYPVGLTAREVEILRLVAAGHTNRQIADALSLSPRTIDVHVRNIFAKTRTDNRAGATAFAFRHDLA